ncbi:3-hydroxyacyl-ACP dehydratase FabZ family protein [Amycolatopsis palatopharyngis]|uniref:3-hydroxyacyl-ACP dehydratase FabZ family protein n=1 Tax=Amycolatopsis palatopharyngis TaxID=187982 RepID=UPI000E224AAF|nr:FabA/FabZ family ACP-dehydratase [Amycolatopsis palatopharyngis]
MTTTATGVVTAPAVPASAAPLCAIDSWHTARDGSVLKVTTRTRIRGEDPNLRGHFPGLAVFPGVFVIEALCQAMTVAIGQNDGRRPALRTLRSVRFLAPLLDGDDLTLVITVTPRSEGEWDVAASGMRADGTISARLRADFDSGEAVDA